MNKKQIFEFKSYKSYLISVLGGEGKKTGGRADAARAIGCQSAYISQVLNGKAHLSLEQAYKLVDFLGHDMDEKQYFLFLVQKDRAGTTELAHFFQEQLYKIEEQRKSIQKRLKIGENLSLEDKSVYYSRWLYAAVHVALTIPHLQQKEALSQHFRLPLSVISDVVEFLSSRGMAVKKGDRYTMGPRHVHLAEDSAEIKRVHTNWRLEALASVDEPKPNDLHYSVVYSLSKNDAVQLRERFMELIRKNLKDIDKSPEEVLYCNTIDFFEL